MTWYSDLIEVAARLARRQSLPSHFAEDWPARPTGRSVAAKIERAHDWLGAESYHLRRAADRARNDLRSLRAFARDVMGEWPHECGVDGFELQDLAVKHGLLVPVKMTSPCGEGCQCAEYYESDELAEGVTCYRKTELLLPGEGS